MEGMVASSEGYIPRLKCDPSRGRIGLIVGPVAASPAPEASGATGRSNKEEAEMDADNSQTHSKPVIEADLGANGGKVSFYTIEQASQWIDKEIMRWQNFLSAEEVNESSFIIKQLDIEQRQLRLPRKIKQRLDYARSADHDEQSVAFREIAELFESYKEYRSLCSRTSAGEEIIQTSVLEDPDARYLAYGGLLGMLQVPMGDILEIMRKGGPFVSRMYNGILWGYTTWRTVNFLEKPDIMEQMDRFDAVIRQAEERAKQVNEDGTTIKEESATILKNLQSDWSEFREAAEKERKGLEKAFEEHMRLHAPATYWRDRADSATRATKWALAAFSFVALAIVGLFIAFGPELLERLAAVEGAGSLAPLALVSIPALIALWGLRHAARLFVANFDRGADARMRETMATTFLALTREGGGVEREERLLVLEALFRPPVGAGTDDGHFGGVFEVLARRNPPA